MYCASRDRDNSVTISTEFTIAAAARPRQHGHGDRWQVNEPQHASAHPLHHCGNELPCSLFVIERAGPCEMSYMTSPISTQGPLPTTSLRIADDELHAGAGGEIAKTATQVQSPDASVSHPLGRDRRHDHG